MSVRSRWWLAAATVLCWVTWIACLIWGHNSHDPDLDSPHEVIGLVLRTVTVVITVSLVLGCLISPRAALLRVGREIGRAEQRRECECHHDSARSSSQVLPFKRTRHN